MRVVIEPRVRTVDPALMMEQLFKTTELESRFPMNMNVLVDGVIPRVGLAERGVARNGSTIAVPCCSGARVSGSPRSRIGSKFSPGCASSSSIWMK